MDASTARTENIRMLVREAHGPIPFAKQVDRDPVQVRQWISESRPKSIGSRLARDIERRLGLEHGWLDMLHIAVESQAPRLDPEILADTASLLRRFYHDDDWSSLLEVHPDLFIEAYKLCAEEKASGLPQSQRRANAARMWRVAMHIHDQGEGLHAGRKHAPTDGASKSR